MATIRNPIEWGVDALKSMGGHANSTAKSVAGDRDKAAELPAINQIGLADIRQALKQGFDDFLSFRTDVLALSVVYPAVGLLLWWAAANSELVPLLFPLASGFALLGPVAAVGLYEMSRQREQGKTASWLSAFDVVRSPSAGSMIVLGLVLLGVFLAWLFAAQMIYMTFLGPAPPASMGSFLTQVFATTPGRLMALIGVGVGFVFALLVFATSVISFPLLLDRNVGVAGAIVTSIRAVAANPVPMTGWGLIVAGGLLAGSLPMLLGLVVVVPVLGHATWHLYRKLVAR